MYDLFKGAATVFCWFAYHKGLQEIVITDSKSGSWREIDGGEEISYKHTKNTHTLGNLDSGLWEDLEYPEKSHACTERTSTFTQILET